MTLHLDDDELASCVQCGLCLPHCPTWRVSGDEARSPRGRIAVMRDVQWNDVPVDRSVLESFESCVQCRGCEPACPSGVPFGHLIEATRDSTARGVRRRRWAYRALDHPRLLAAGATMLALVQRTGWWPRHSVVPRLDLARRRLDLDGRLAARLGGVARGDVWFVTGCVMDAVQRSVHQDCIDVLTVLGYTVRLPERAAGCCGALAAHGGDGETARTQARGFVAAFSDAAGPIVVDSAGCGAHLRQVGELLEDDPDAAAVAALVVDVHEVVERHLDELRSLARPVGRVTVQDPCHLRHVQGVHGSVHRVLGACATPVELDDDGLCCGAGGAFALSRPDDAVAIRARKLDAIGRAGVTVVASANPGCQLHLRAAGIDARHPMSIVAEAISVR